MVSIMEFGAAPQQQPVQQQVIQQQQHVNSAESKPPKSAVSQSSIELQLSPKSNNTDLAKRALKLDLVSATKELEDFGIKSPRSPLANSVLQSTVHSMRRCHKEPIFYCTITQFSMLRCGRLPHQTSLTAQVDLVEDRKTLRDALYQGIFHRHRRTIFAVGSFLRMLRSRNSQYNTIRSSSEGEDIDDAR